MQEQASIRSPHSTPYHATPAYLPSPEEIAAKTAAIREDWSDSEYSARYYYGLDFDHEEGYGTPTRINASERPGKIGTVSVVPTNHALHRE